MFPYISRSIELRFDGINRTFAGCYEVATYQFFDVVANEDASAYIQLRYCSSVMKCPYRAQTAIRLL